MPRAPIPKISNGDTDQSQGGPPDPALIVIQGALDWLRIRHQHVMPPPCPPDPGGCVRWWLDHMQEPEQPGETYRTGSTGSNVQGWYEGYACRCRNALLRYLDLTPVQRSAVTAGVIEGRVPYRGDDFSVYLAIHAETLRAREMGADAYREMARKLVGLGVRKIAGGAHA